MNRMKSVISILLLLVVLCSLTNGDEEDFNNFVTEMETLLLSHKKNFLDAYSNRCPLECPCSRSTCDSQLYHATKTDCSADFGHPTINQDTDCTMCRRS